jgi:trk system potassium uptake protein
VRVVVVGCGRVGAGLATRLDLNGHDVRVVDRDLAAFSRLGSTFSGITVTGMGLDRHVLLEAGMERADALAAVTGSDEVNAVVGRIAARRFRVPRVAARMYDPRAAEVYRRLGVPTISPVAWGVGRLAELLVLIDVGSITTLGAGQVDLIEVVVPALLDDRPVGELEMPGEIRAAAVTRAGRTFVPDGATRLHGGDIVVLAVSGGGTERLESLLGRRS